MLLLIAAARHIYADISSRFMADADIVAINIAACHGGCRGQI